MEGRGGEKKKTLHLTEKVPGEGGREERLKKTLSKRKKGRQNGQKRSVTQYHRGNPSGKT